MTVGGLFDGCGLLAYGLHLAGFEHRWLCEKDEFRAGLLEQRFPGIPVYRDVRDVGADAEPVDLIAGGFPCKGASQAGRREGFGHPETALWREMLRCVRDIRPRYVLVENVAALLQLHRGTCFGEVIGGLAESGYDAEWDCFPAAAFGAAHGRDRVFVTATSDTDSLRRDGGRAASPEHQGRASLAERGGHFAGRGSDASDAGRARLEGEGLRRPATNGARRARPSDSDAERAGREPRSRLRESDAPGERRRRSPDVRSEAPADADVEGRNRLATLDSTDAGVDVEHRDDADGRGVGVEWGRYAGAIRRWENIVGRPAPEPLIRRVADGRTGRVERSRLSALGDGVLVQAGWFVGRRIMLYEEDKNAA